jgi:hypothetical protein
MNFRFSEIDRRPAVISLIPLFSIDISVILIGYIYDLEATPVSEGSVESETEKLYWDETMASIVPASQLPNFSTYQQQSVNMLTDYFLLVAALDYC